MLKKIVTILTVLAMVATLALPTLASGVKDVPVTGVSLMPKVVTLEIGQTMPLTTAIVPEDATNKNVSYSSSAPEIAIADATGLLTCLAQGQATITVTTQDGGYTDSCVVYVSTPYVALESITLEPEDGQQAVCWVGGTLQLVTHFFPENASNKNVRYVFVGNDMSVGSVDENGLVTGYATGAGLILCISEENLDIQGALFISILPPTVFVEGISLTTHEATLNVGESLRLSFDITPSHANNKSVEYISSNADVATVSRTNGIVTAVGEGQATITVTTNDGGFTDSCLITVTDQGIVNVTGISITPSSVELKVNDTLELIATVTPENAANRNVLFASSDTSVATVNASGVVTALAEGNVTITATTVDGGFTATCVITVSSSELIFGDVNGDGSLNTGDVAALLCYFVGLMDIDEAHLAIADVNGDGYVNTGDASWLLEYVLA